MRGTAPIGSWSIMYGSGTSNSTALSYDGYGRLVQIVETVNGTTQSAELFVWIGNTMVEQRNATGAVVKAYFDQGFLNGSTAYYYGQDYLGEYPKPELIRPALFKPRIDYGPYGEITELSAQAALDFSYTGLFYHQRSGLDFAEYRGYDSGLRRWLNRDPDAQKRNQTNVYDYVGKMHRIAKEFESTWEANNRTLPTRGISQAASRAKPHPAGLGRVGPCLPGG